jgi:hypothetical protein
MHHGDKQTLQIIPDKCQETHNAHTQEWSNFYNGWIKSTWAHWHTHPPPTSEVRSSKSWTPSLPASERGSFLTGAARLVSAPTISARWENRHPNQELKCIPYKPLSFTYKPSSDYIQDYGIMKPQLMLLEESCPEGNSQNANSLWCTHVVANFPCNQSEWGCPATSPPIKLGRQIFCTQNSVEYQCYFATAVLHKRQ